MNSVVDRMRDKVARQAGDAADGQAVANAALDLWGEIHAQLGPLIGSGGVFAIYRRSLYLERNQYKCLGAAFEESANSDGLAALHTALGKESREWALLAHSALLANFYGHLVRLIGASLAERVFTKIAPPSSGGEPAPTAQP